MSTGIGVRTDTAMIDTDAVFRRAIDGVIGREGRYSDHPADHGGATAWGITEAVARAEGRTGAMASLSREMAISIYHRRYWRAPDLDRIAALDIALAERLLDLGINMGPPVGIRFLQRALNVLNRQQAAFADIAVDGAFGPATEAALASFLRQRGADGALVLRGMVIALQAVRYIEIAERDPSQEDFEFGWQLNRALGDLVPRPAIPSGFAGRNLGQASPTARP
jgi:lysozyme family protein